MAAGAFALFARFGAVAPAMAAPGDPIAVKISSCPAGAECDTVDCASAGYGNLPELRWLTVALAFETVDSTDDVAAALAATHRIEICGKREGEDPWCPGAGEWLVWDEASATGSLPPAAHVFRNPSITVPKRNVALRDVDWNDLFGYSIGLGLYVRVNGEGVPLDSLADDLARGGACMHQQRLAWPDADGRVDVFGPKYGHTPFSPQVGFNVCADGSLVNWTAAGGPTPAGLESCVTATTTVNRPGWLRDVVLSFDEAHQTQLQARVPQDRRVDSWLNGTVNGVRQPFHVFVGPNRSAGSAGSGYVRLRSSILQQVDPNAAPQASAGGIVGMLGHEYTHSFITAWSRTRPGGIPHYGGPWLGEALPDTTRHYLCLEHFPHAPPGEDCVNAGRLYGGLVPSAADAVLPRPQAGMFAGPYDGATLWRYVVEQFAHPLGTTAHPSGLDSALPRPDTTLDDPSSALHGRKPNEGLDFIGLYFDGLDAEHDRVSTRGAIEHALAAHLGRSLDEVMIDAYTALYLREYNDTGDTRFRYEWIGDFNALAPIEAQKPFTVPQNLYGELPDGVVRGYRVLDSWGSCQSSPSAKYPLCLKAAVRPTLAAGDGIAGTEPVGLGPYGAAVLSVHPETAGGGGIQWQSQVLGVHIRVAGRPNARFRIFRILREAGGKLRPHALCAAPSYECPVVAQAGGGYRLDAAVPITANTDEVLVLGVANRLGESFEWSFGTLAPRVEIVAPTPSNRAYVGHPNGADGRRAFLATLAARDGLGASLAVTKGQLALSVESWGSPLCTLAGEDFTFLPLSGGHIELVVALPSACYPALPDPITGSSKALDLVVTVAGVPEAARQPLAIQASLDARRQATVLVLDESATMGSGDGEKLLAAKVALRALAHALLPVDGGGPTHEAALVAFRDDAETWIDLGPLDATTLPFFEAALDTIAAGGHTSIGDGVLEAQSLLASRYDFPAAGVVVPDDLQIVVASDGKNDRDYRPFTYYAQGGLADGNGDGNGLWYQGPLTRAGRLTAGLRLPRVSTIAIGQDADLAELQTLAFLGGGSFVHLPGPEDGATSLTAVASDMLDGFFAATNTGAGFARIFTASGARGLLPVIPVDDGADELRLIAVALEGGVGDLLLRTPSDELVEPSSLSAAEDVAVFRVAAPEAGSYELVATGAWPGEAPLFVEAAVRSTAELLVRADVADVAPLVVDAHGYESRRYRGAEVFLRAVPHALGPMLDCGVLATVTSPATAVAAREATLELFDDGRHGDGEARDGVYGARLARTLDPGGYDVVFRASCPGKAAGGLVEREARAAFELHADGDSDGDGLDDAWEGRLGLDPTAGRDAREDGDGDGLDNLAEAAAGTDPREADTDAGGEADGSEVAAGLSPTDPADDRLTAPELSLVPGYDRVGVWLGLSTRTLEVELERADAGGEFEAVGLPGRGDVLFVDVGVPAEEELCYRARALGVEDGAESPWSPPVCTVARLDPVAPVVELGAERTVAPKNERVLALVASDPSATSPLAEFAFDAEATGVAEIRFDISPRFESAAWVPFGEAATVMPKLGRGSEMQKAVLRWDPAARELGVKLQTMSTAQIYVQVRDRAGNESRVFSRTVNAP